LRVYEGKKVRDRGFSDVADAQCMAKLVGSSYPDLTVDLYIELDDSSAIDLSDLEEKAVSDGEVRGLY
jgi:hypothetical protein